MRHQAPKTRSHIQTCQNREIEGGERRELTKARCWVPFSPLLPSTNHTRDPQGLQSRLDRSTPPTQPTVPAAGVTLLRRARDGEREEEGGGRCCRPPHVSKLRCTAVQWQKSLPFPHGADGDCCDQVEDRQGPAADHKGRASSHAMASVVSGWAPTGHEGGTERRGGRA